MTLFLTDTEREQLRADLAKAEHLAREHARLLAGIRATLAEAPVDVLAPSYWPERMGYLSELRRGLDAFGHGVKHLGQERLHGGEGGSPRLGQLVGVEPGEAFLLHHGDQ